jgi:subtilisin family serine protease
MENRYSMNMKIILILSLLISTNLYAQTKPVVIAVIDTGYTQIKGQPKPNLCKFGHTDLTGESPTGAVPSDNIGHGTHIAQIINKQLSDLPKESYCLVILKYTDRATGDQQAVQNTIGALMRSLNMQVDIINYSSAGSSSSEFERGIVKRILDDKITLVVSAGNSGARIVSEQEVAHDIVFPKNKSVREYEILEYPANYDNRVVVVGNLTKSLTANPSSNYGNRVNAWEIGTDVEAGGTISTGTSQATAVHTGKLVRKMIKGKM